MDTKKVAEVTADDDGRRIVADENQQQHNSNAGEEQQPVVAASSSAADPSLAAPTTTAEPSKVKNNNNVAEAQILNITSSSLCNLLVYTSGESDSDNDDDDDGVVESDDSDSYECDSDVQEVIVKPTTKPSGEPKQQKQNTLLDTLKSMGELTIDDLPPVPDISSLNISLSREECDEIGKISSIVDKLVMVESIPNKPAYDIDTLLFLDTGKQPLGYIFDVIGPVTSPIYCIRFNSVEEINALNISKGLPVYSAPNSEHTQYVFVQQLLKAKGSDASWKEDREVTVEHEDFSDDEAETAKRRGVDHDNRKRHSLERHRTFEKDMNVKNLIDSRLHKIRDNFEPTTKKHTPNGSYNGGKRGYHFQPSYRPNIAFTQANVSGTSCAFPPPPPFGMPPPLMPSNLPLSPYGPQAMPPFVPSMAPAPPPFFARLPAPPAMQNLPPFPPPMSAPFAPQEMVSPMFSMPPPPVAANAQMKTAPSMVYPPDMGLPRPPTQSPAFVPNMPFFDPRVRMWHSFPAAPPNTRQTFPKNPRTFYPKRQ